MTDSTLDRAGDKLQETADRWAAEGGVKAKVAPSLADDAEFIRKLKPSLMVARAKGEAPTNESPVHGRIAPSGPQVRGPKKSKARSGGISPWLVAALALAAGIAAAKVIDWRGHAHPRD
jgi:hypothetical protein